MRFPHYAIMATILAFSIFFYLTAEAEHMTRQDIKDGYKEHAALTQLHRWYQFYEHDEVPIENQLEILAPDINLKSGLGEATGHEAYKERVKQIPASWQNAHFTDDPEITIGENGEIALNVDITYLNVGMAQNGKTRTANLSYATKLTLGEAVLPQFNTIEITQNSEDTAGEFRDAYPENRLKSLMHYWLALIEDPVRNAGPVREILADDFVLNFSSGAITDFEGFKTWLATTGSQVVASTHKPDNSSYNALPNNQYELNVDFDWQGILPDESEMTAKTRHTWLVEDNPAERFAKIVTMDVEILEPFAPKNK